MFDIDSPKCYNVIAWVKGSSPNTTVNILKPNGLISNLRCLMVNILFKISYGYGPRRYPPKNIIFIGGH